MYKTRLAAKHENRIKVRKKKQNELIRKQNETNERIKRKERK